jgi:hypothetical protein
MLRGVDDLFSVFACRRRSNNEEKAEQCNNNPEQNIEENGGSPRCKDRGGFRCSHGL